MAPTGIGERLQIARTARGLTLDDIEAATRIKRRYLDAIEREAWDELPGPAYARGFLGAYARQLGLPPDEIVGQYRSAGTTGGPGPGPVEVRITPGAPQSRLRRIVTAVAVIFIAGTIVLTYVLVGQLRQFAATRPRPGVTANPNTSAPPAPRPPAVVTPTAPLAGAARAAGASPPPAAAPVAAPPGAIVLSAQATDRSWVRVVSDGAVVFEGFVSAGEHETWQGRQVIIRIGNASALDLSVNGRPIGRLGNPGDVVERTFGATPSGAPSAPAAPPAAVPAGPPPAAPPARPAPPAAPTPPSAPGPVAPGPPTGPPPSSPPANNNHQ